MYVDFKSDGYFHKSGSDLSKKRSLDSKNNAMRLELYSQINYILH